MSILKMARLKIDHCAFSEGVKSSSHFSDMSVKGGGVDPLFLKHRRKVGFFYNATLNSSNPYFFIKYPQKVVSFFTLPK